MKRKQGTARQRGAGAESAENGPAGILREAPTVGTIPGQRRFINVRAAKDQLSSLLDQAAAGMEVIITSDGQPKARLMAPRTRAHVFRTDWNWLRGQPLSSGESATDLVRVERDGRD